MTMPQANGLYVFSSNSNRSPRPPVISSHFTSVLTTCAQPLLPSRPASDDVKFFDASRAAVKPFCDARPGWKLFVIEPNISRKPTGCAAAKPNAQTICCSLSPSSLPHAAAAPKTPAVPVMCQPRS